jgi:PTH1 family peptidyl-tRNA hydrolase
MQLLAGLGNPTPAYAGHRHNIGFMAVDAIAARHRFSSWRRKFQGEIAEGEIAGERVLALKPMTYMNLSGQSVGEALRFYKLEPAALTVFYDELDLPLGRVRVKTGGGLGSHNGIRDVVGHCGPEFRRVRLGIDHPGDRALVEFYVLQDFAKAERPIVEKLLDCIATEIPRLVAGDDAAFMSRIALAMNPPRPRPPKPEPPPEHET